MAKSARSMTLTNGNLALALIRHQVTVVSVSKANTKSDPYLDVQAYSPFGERLFLASDHPVTRIGSSDILAVLPSNGNELAAASDSGVLEVPPEVFAEYLNHTSRQHRKRESLWRGWVSSH